MVGGGPVGLTTAASLNYHGIKTIVVEKKTAISVLAKAQFLSGRSIEHYRQIGLEKLVQNAAWARDQQVTIRICNQILNGNSLVLNKISSWGDIVDKKPGCKFLFYKEGMSASAPLMCPQTSLEPALREHLDGKENVSMLWGWEVANLEQDANGATLTIVSGEGEDRQEMQIRATFVVACDGGRSPLRRLLDVHTYGEFVFARAVGMTIRSNQLFERLKQITGAGHFVVINKKFFSCVC